MDFLREWNAAYCIVDMPQVRSFPSSRIEVTSDIAFVRFHGQNRERWASRTATRDERYDYEYSEKELKGWVPTLLDLNTKVKDTYVLFNNHCNAKAPQNATALERLLHAPSVRRIK